VTEQLVRKVQYMYNHTCRSLTICSLLPHITIAMHEAPSGLQATLEHAVFVSVWGLLRTCCVCTCCVEYTTPVASFPLASISSALVPAPGRALQAQSPCVWRPAVSLGLCTALACCTLRDFAQSCSLQLPSLGTRPARTCSSCEKQSTSVIEHIVPLAKRDSDCSPM
jgi:hypothetical protein